jgi:LacI family fructose operon transcriptional repressor
MLRVRGLTADGVGLVFIEIVIKRVAGPVTEQTMSSIKDVASIAGVSTATVSRVLADKPHVRAEVRERVLKAVEELNYRPNPVARCLRSRTSNIVGLIVADIQNPFFSEVARAVEDAAYQMDMSVFVCNSDEDPRKEELYLRLMREQNVAGIILSPTRQFCESEHSDLQTGAPMVVIDRRLAVSSADTVILNNEEAAYDLTRHLLEHGHQNIAGLFGNKTPTGTERRNGFLRALKGSSLKPRPELICSVPATLNGGCEGARELLALEVPPDAILASNALISAGAFKAIRDAKLAVPGTIAFAAFDETSWAGLVRPGITVVQQPTREIGETAMELLLRRIKHPGRPLREVILKGELIVRGSCGTHSPQGF